MEAGFSKAVAEELYSKCDQDRDGEVNHQDIGWLVSDNLATLDQVKPSCKSLKIGTIWHQDCNSLCMSKDITVKLKAKDVLMVYMDLHGWPCGLKLFRVSLIATTCRSLPVFVSFPAIQESHLSERGSEKSTLAENFTMLFLAP